ncbi:hypothetical protein KsCSTR_33680 [Candidatus Kuenenia stuttgartiensis]|uniref:Uncharacterized protein n=1 Tax=Kuenenia stuttgartiensis TaxID=174633 RepID=A0A6G7GU61_KUEST|nr:hypothetical protein KsCSTR_33680 [Candidatus Kuenenia stuttgartiensis]
MKHYETIADAKKQTTSHCTYKELKLVLSFRPAYAQ